MLMLKEWNKSVTFGHPHTCIHTVYCRWIHRQTDRVYRTWSQEITNETHRSKVSASSILLYCNKTFPNIHLCWSRTDVNKKQLFSAQMSLSKDLCYPYLPIQTKKNRKSDFYTKNNWSRSTSAQTPSLAAYSGSVLIQTVRRKNMAAWTSAC